MAGGSIGGVGAVAAGASIAVAPVSAGSGETNSQGSSGGRKMAFTGGTAKVSLSNDLFLALLEDIVKVNKSLLAFIKASAAYVASTKASAGSTQTVTA